MSTELALMTLHNQFPSTDFKVEKFVKTHDWKPAFTQASDQEKRAFLLAAKKQIQSTPSIFDCTLQDIESQLAKIQ